MTATHMALVHCIRRSQCGRGKEPVCSCLLTGRTVKELTSYVVFPSYEVSAPCVRAVFWPRGAKYSSSFSTPCRAARRCQSYYGLMQPEDIYMQVSFTSIHSQWEVPDACISMMRLIRERASFRPKLNSLGRDTNVHARSVCREGGDPDLDTKEALSGCRQLPNGLYCHRNLSTRGLWIGQLVREVPQNGRLRPLLNAFSTQRLAHLSKHTSCESTPVHVTASIHAQGILPCLVPPTAV